MLELRVFKFAIMKESVWRGIINTLVLCWKKSANDKIFNLKILRLKLNFDSKIWMLLKGLNMLLRIKSLNIRDKTLYKNIVSLFKKKKKVNVYLYYFSIESSLYELFIFYILKLL